MHPAWMSLWNRLRGPLFCLVDFLMICLLIILACNLSIAWYEAETDHLLIVPYPEHELPPQEPQMRGGKATDTQTTTESLYRELSDARTKVAGMEGRVTNLEQQVKNNLSDIKELDNKRQLRWEQNENRFARIETNLDNLVWWHRGISIAVIGQIVGVIWVRVKGRNGDEKGKQR